MTHKEKVRRISKILKKNFSNLETGKLVYIAYLIIETLEEPNSLVEIKPDARVP